MTFSAILPFAVFLAGNATVLVHPGGVVLDAALATSVSLLAFSVARLLTRRSPPVAVGAGFAVFNLCFWNYHRLFGYEQTSEQMRWAAIGTWLLITALVVTLAFRVGRRPLVSTFLMLFLTIWTITSVGGFAISRSQASSGAPPAIATAAFTPFVDRPNVYWLVLDEHANAEQFHHVTGGDNRGFDDALRERGFSVSETSRSSYLHTQLSIFSTLAMDYPYTPGNTYGSDFLSSNPIIMGDNPVVGTFESNGYRYVYAPDGGVDWVDCPTEIVGDRICVPPIGGTQPLVGTNLLLARTTPIGALPLDVRYNDMASVLAGIEANRGDEPLFVYAHLLTPHFPTRYESDCSLRDPFLYGYHLSGQERLANYANDVRCLDDEILSGVDRLLTHDPDAVIIVQSDHGTRFTFDWDRPFDQWTPENLNERFSAVNAIRLPASCRERSIEGEPLVNTFRLVLACLAGSEPDLVDPRTFYSNFHQISTLTEVPAEAFTVP